MKKLHLLIGAVSAFGIIAGATSCGSQDTTKPTTQLSVKEKKNIETLTGVKLLQSALSTSTMRTMNCAYRAMNQDEINTKDIEDILPSIDALLNNGSVLNSTITEEDTIINDVTYKFKEEVTYKDSNLKDATYTLVYNKEVLTEKAKENGKEENKEENKDQESEQSERLDGYVFISTDEKYPFTSISESETEKNESEVERTFKVNINETSYVLVEEENEAEKNEAETEFEYTFVNNGKVELNYSISIENHKDGLKEVEYEKNGVEYEVKKTVRDNKEVFKVEREDANDEEAKFFFEKVIAEDGSVSFVRL